MAPNGREIAPTDGIACLLHRRAERHNLADFGLQELRARLHEHLLGLRAQTLPIGPILLGAVAKPMPTWHARASTGYLLEVVRGDTDVVVELLRDGSIGLRERPTILAANLCQHVLPWRQEGARAGGPSFAFVLRDALVKACVGRMSAIIFNCQPDPLPMESANVALLSTSLRKSVTQYRKLTCLLRSSRPPKVPNLPRSANIFLGTRYADEHLDIAPRPRLPKTLLTATWRCSPFKWVAGSLGEYLPQVVGLPACQHLDHLVREALPDRLDAAQYLLVETRCCHFKGHFCDLRHMSCGHACVENATADSWLMFARVAVFVTSRNVTPPPSSCA